MSSSGGSGPTPLPSPVPDILYGSGRLTPNLLKESVIQQLGTSTPEAIISGYCQEIEPWFPLISEPRLRTLVPQMWEYVSLDVTLLCLSIKLLTSTPSSSSEAEYSHDDLQSLYLYVKSSLSATEGLGMNSLLLVQSRILVTLFEAAHGFYPAAYISIGTTVRAVDALQSHPIGDFSLSQASDDGTKGDETLLTWGGILILDRYASRMSLSDFQISMSDHSVQIHNYRVRVSPLSYAAKIPSPPRPPQARVVPDSQTQSRTIMSNLPPFSPLRSLVSPRSGPHHPK